MSSIYIYLVSWFHAFQRRLKLGFLKVKQITTLTLFFIIIIIYFRLRKRSCEKTLPVPNLILIRDAIMQNEQAPSALS